MEKAVPYTFHLKFNFFVQLKKSVGSILTWFKISIQFIFAVPVSFILCDRK